MVVLYESNSIRRQRKDVGSYFAQTRSKQFVYFSFLSLFQLEVLYRNFGVDRNAFDFDVCEIFVISNKFSAQHVSIYCVHIPARNA